MGGHGDQLKLNMCEMLLSTFVKLVKEGGTNFFIPNLLKPSGVIIIINNNRSVTLVEHTSDHGKQTNHSGVIMAGKSIIQSGEVTGENSYDLKKYIYV